MSSPLPTVTIPTCTIDDTGIHKPEFAAVKSALETLFRSVYGQDIYIDADSQDGQLIGALALAFSDSNAMAVSVYNSFSPSTGQGLGLSSNVKINGITRKVPSLSTVDLLLVGQAGTTIVNGIATDAAGVQWYLPASVTIPAGGSVTATASPASAGAVTAPANTITVIGTPTRGWQTVTNPAAATPGQPVESDAQLRLRQAASTALPSRSIMEGIVGAVLSITGVTRVRAYENDTPATDANGIPANSLCMVIDGGDSTAIATAIITKKTPGTALYGSTSVTINDVYGIPRIVKFQRPSLVTIKYAITVKALAGYTAAVEASIQASLVAWTTARSIGEPLFYTRALVPANLYGGPGSTTFEITAMTFGRVGALGTSDVVLLFSEAATSVAADVVITVT